MDQGVIDLTKIAEAEGWKCARAGWPDLILYKLDKEENITEAIFVECKRKHKGIQPEQLTILRLLERLGLKVRISAFGGVGNLLTLDHYLTGDYEQPSKVYKKTTLYTMRTKLNRLQERLFDMEAAGEVDTPDWKLVYGVAKKYADVFNEPVLIYRNLLKEEENKFTPEKIEERYKQLAAEAALLKMEEEIGDTTDERPVSD